MRSNKKTIRALKSRFLFALCIIGFSIAGCSCTANSSEKVQDLSLFIRLDCLDDIEYHAINADEREKYCIAPDNEGSAITKNDLGEYIGVISEVRNGSGKGVLGRKAYHYSEYPDSNAVILVDFGRNYSFFCTYGYYVDIPEGEYSDLFIDKYGLPQNVVKIVIKDDADNIVKTITEDTQIKLIADVLKGCINIGFEELNRRLSDVWFKRYNNTLVHFDKDTGRIIYESANAAEWQKNTQPANTQDEAVTECEPENYSLIDTAHALWSEGEFSLLIEVKEGYIMQIAYCPQAQSFSAFSGVFDLSEQKMEILDMVYKE